MQSANWGLRNALGLLVGAALALGAVSAGARPARSMKEVRSSFPLDSSALLEKPDTLVLYELDPTRRKPADGATFHGWSVVKQMDVPPPQQKELTDALFTAMAEQKVGARCFIPHHGLRAMKGGKTVDLVLCFTCQWVVIHHEGHTRKALLAHKPIALYDRVLRQVPNPPSEPAKAE